MLKARPEEKDIIDTELVYDPKLTAENVRGFRRAYKELYNFTMVSPKCMSACMRCRVVLT
jgi:hypothetical protein